jgi:hypothetical protein
MIYAACSMQAYAWRSFNEPNQALNGGKSILFATAQKIWQPSKHLPVKIWDVKFTAKSFGM